jgi:opacity protein-like surface antigen
MLLRISTLALVAAMAAGAASAQTTPSNWSGFYFGGSAGYADPSKDGGETLQFDTNRDGTYGDSVNTSLGANAFSPGFCDGAAKGTTPAAGCRDTGGNLSLSLRAGYDWQWGNWVAGGLLEATKVRIGDDVAGFSTTPASYSFSRDLESTIAARVRGGYAFDNYLAYATGGMVWGDLSHDFNTTNTANSFTPSGDDDTDGYQIGAGFEMKVTPNMSVGLEYLFTSLDDEYVVDVGPGTAGLTNPFRIVNPAGTYMRRSEDKFEYDTISVTASWRY